MNFFETGAVTIAAFLAFTAISSCKSPYETLAAEQFPFGVWESRSKYRLEVYENNTWRFCAPKKGACDTGELIWSALPDDQYNPNPPYLFNFGNQAVAISMYEQMPSYRFRLEENPSRLHHPTLYQFETKKSLFYCRRRPCFSLDGVDQKKFSFYLTDKKQMEF